MAKILDVILCCVGIFFVAFAWVYYCLRDVSASLWLATTLTVCGGYVLYRVIAFQSGRIVSKKQSKSRLNALSNHLCFDEKISTLFTNMLKYYRFDVANVEQENILATKDGKTFYVALCFGEEKLEKSTFRNHVLLAKTQNADKVIVFCNGASAQLQQLANEQLPTQIVDVANTYRLLEQCDKLPPLKKAKVSKPAYFAQYAFSKGRFGAYLLGAVFMLLTSALTLFSLYSIVWATILFALALYSLLNKKYNTQPTAVTLD